MDSTLSFVILGKAIVVKDFPTIGELIKIETIKLEITQGGYQRMVNTQTTASTFALDLVDCLSFLLVMVPGEKLNFLKDHMKDSKSLDITNLPGANSLEFVKVYRNKIFPWYKEFLKVIYELTSEAEGQSEGN